MTLSIDAISVDETTLSAPDLTLLSTQSLDGTGAFDVLMKTTKMHLQDEYNEGRITGEEYATVYLGGLTAVLQQAVQYLLNHQHAEKVSAEIGLIRQQTVTELTQTDDTIPEGLGFNGDTNVEGLVKSKKDLDALQESLVNAQITKSTRDGVLVGQQIITELAQTDNDISTAAATYGLNNTSDMLGMVKAQQDKVAAEIELLTQKIVTEVAQTSDEKPFDLGQMPTINIDGLMKLQRDQTAAAISKMAVEEDLITQQIVTEVAQTSDEKPMSLGQMSATTAITGLINAQKDKIDQEIANMVIEGDLLTEKIVTEIAQTSDSKPSTLGQMSTPDITGIAKAQRDKISAEVTLLAQKSITELAQTSDTLNLNAGALNSSAATTGVIEKQKDLFAAQTAGFARDAEQKLAKMMIDAWSVARTTDPDNVARDESNRLGDGYLSLVMQKTQEGIGAGS
jgi:hypothetical protein